MVLAYVRAIVLVDKGVLLTEYRKRLDFLQPFAANEGIRDKETRISQLNDITLIASNQLVSTHLSNGSFMVFLSG
jgi:hypothetical protein